MIQHEIDNIGYEFDKLERSWQNARDGWLDDHAAAFESKVMIPVLELRRPLIVVLETLAAAMPDREM